MRLLPFLLAICAGVVCIGTRAEAQNYPWCASYSAGDTGGGMNCGFTTFQQCLDTVRGMGDFCEQNTQYQPPPGPHSFNKTREGAIYIDRA
jgi:Protein of unknown function (DUF3551)